jgi:large exoprotein involved in heme utilization and adhesion
MTTVTTGSGDAGNLTVNTGRLMVRDGAALTSGNDRISTGSGGALRVNAIESVELQGKAVLGTTTVGSGDAGSIAVEAGRVTLRDGAVISADTAGSGNAGELAIRTATLDILDGSRIGSATVDEGLGATLTIDASDSVRIVGISADGEVPSGLFANALGISDAGDINLETGQLVIQDGGRISTSTSGPGNGGDTAIAAESVSLINDAAIVASTTGRGDAGNIKLQVDGSITLVDSFIRTAVRPNDAVEGFESGDFTTWAVKGDRSIETSAFGSNPPEGTQQALLTNAFSDNFFPIPSAELEAFLGLAPGSLEGLNNGTPTEGSAMKTTFTAQAGDVITLDWQFLTNENTPAPVYNDFAFVTLIQTSELADTGFPDDTGSGFAGSPTPFVSQTGLQTFTATIPASGTYTLGIGVVDVADINDDFRSGVLVDRVSLPTGTGSGGDIDIHAQSLTLTDNSQVEALTRGRGNSGNVRVDTSDFVELSGGGLFTSSETANSGRSGNISVNTGQLGLRNGAVLNAQTQSFNDGGDITVDGRTLTVTSGGQLRTTTFNSGDAGDINLNLSESAVLTGAGSGLFGQTAGAGTAGNLTIDTPELFLQDRARVSASTSGTGRSGNIFVQNADSVRLASQSAISTEVEAGAAVSPTTEPGGDIDIQTQLLSLTDGARVTASTSGRGDAGNIAVWDAASVFLANDSVISTAVNAGAIGQGGDVAIQTDALALESNAQILASTDGQGDAGNISANSDRISLQGGSQISAATAGGEGGSIILRGNALDVRDGSRLSTTTAGSNDAGNIDVKIADGITLTGTGSGFFASTEADSTGDGGSILSDSRTLTIREGAGIAVDSQGTGVGGSVQIQAESATLEEQAFISAETTSNTGGDLTLQLRDYLLLRHNSRISTTAGTAQAGGDGGNIGIDTDFIIAVPEENSDITANAFEGRGGNINITAQGIYGIEFRDELTPFSDITASSELGLDGEVSINTPGIEPDRGLATLPGEPRNPQPLEGCQAGAGESGSRFISTGRGGLPSSPTEPLGSSEIWEDVQPPSQQAQISPPERIVEAEGWMVNDRGEVVLVAQSSAPSRLPCDR